VAVDQSSALQVETLGTNQATGGLQEQIESGIRARRPLIPIKLTPATTWILPPFHHHLHQVDKEFAFHISVRAAMREQPAGARPVILSGLWQGLKLSHLTHAERKAIIRSSMLLKDKYYVDFYEVHLEVDLTCTVIRL